MPGTRGRFHRNTRNRRVIGVVGVTDGHAGIDFFIEIGDYIVSALPTSVVLNVSGKDEPELRVNVWFEDPVNRGQYYETGGTHLSAQLVQGGQVIYRGQLIGLGGNSGSGLAEKRFPVLHCGLEKRIPEGWYLLDPFRYTVNLDPLPTNFWGSEVSYWTKDNDPQFPLVNLGE